MIEGPSTVGSQLLATEQLFSFLVLEEGELLAVRSCQGNRGNWPQCPPVLPLLLVQTPRKKWVVQPGKLALDEQQVGTEPEDLKEFGE